MAQNIQNAHDITIIGAGLVGSALAVALHNTQWRVALVEANDVMPFDSQNLSDSRSLALTYGSQQILQELEIWSKLASSAVPIERIHVSQKGYFGVTLLEAKKMGFSFFGQVMPLPFLLNALQNELTQLKNLTIYRPASVQGLQKSEQGHWQLTLNDQQKLNTKLVVAADGDRSWVRQLLKLPTKKTDYQQTAIATNVHLSSPHLSTAYERFTPEGSVALLPLSMQRAGLVLITESACADEWFSLEDTVFLEKMQQAVGYRVGKLSHLGKRQMHRLQTIEAQKKALPGLVLLGNAANTVHPLAAQGFNLGLRDVADLADTLSKAQDLEAPSLLSDYLKEREKDQEITQKFTNHLVQWFSPKRPLVAPIRGLGLQLFDILPPAKFVFCLRRMGLRK